LWGLYAVGAFDEALAEKTLAHPSPWLRAWTVRLLGEAGQVSDKMLTRLVERAGQDKAPEVRLQLASTAQRLTRQDTLPLLHALMQRQEDARDPCIPLMLWLAYEPRLGVQQPPALEWLQAHAAGNPLVTDEIVPRTLRRLAATGKAEDLRACLAFLGAVKDQSVRRRALEGLVQALQNRQVDPPAEWQRVFTALLQDGDGDVRRLAQRLAVNFRDPEAVRRSLAVARDAQKPAPERIEAIRDLALAHPAEALRPLEELLTGEQSPEIRSEACRALAAYDSPEVARVVLAAWKRYPPALRVEAVNLLAGRRNWARELLTAVGQSQVPRTDLNDNTILRLRGLRDAKLNELIETVWGRVRDTPADLNTLLDQMRVALHEGSGSFERGRKVLENQCAKCHKFEGKGHEVGPNLDGAARDLEYLLVNVLDPNRVVGQPYYTRFVALKNGRVETGLLAAEDDQTVTLKAENDALKVFPKKDVEELTVQPKSVMPEGLANNMTPQDFRDLVRFLMAHPFLTDVAVAGPFGKEQAVPVEPNDPLRAGRLTWTWPAVGPAGRIALPAVRGEGEAKAYVAATVTAPAALRTRLLVGAAYPVQVWLNGKKVYEGKPDRGPTAPDQAGIDVDLQEGVNRLLFQAAYQGGKEMLYARLLDPQRQLQYPERNP
jgi:putative heme-binding domain-containing protein